jgi:hypothetical protein
VRRSANGACCEVRQKEKVCDRSCDDCPCEEVSAPRRSKLGALFFGKLELWGPFDKLIHIDFLHSKIVALVRVRLRTLLKKREGFCLCFLTNLHRKAHGDCVLSSVTDETRRNLSLRRPLEHMEKKKSVDAKGKGKKGEKGGQQRQEQQETPEEAARRRAARAEAKARLRKAYENEQVIRAALIKEGRLKVAGGSGSVGGGERTARKKTKPESGTKGQAEESEPLLRVDYK